MTSESIGVLLVDDHPLVRAGLSGLLDATENLRVVGEAADGASALALAAELAPDVVLMDISMPVMDGFEATSKLREEKPDACVLMLTGSNARVDVDKARTAGASGYVTKDRIAAELIDAILEVVSR